MRTAPLCGPGGGAATSRRSCSNSSKVRVRASGDAKSTRPLECVMMRNPGTASSVAAISCVRIGLPWASWRTSTPPVRLISMRMPAVRSASDLTRASSSSYDARRRDPYSSVAKTASVSVRAVAYHAVSRPRIVCISGLHHVPHAAHRVDHLRLAAVVELLAQPVDHHVDDVGAGIEVVIPRILGDQRARHHPPVVAQQV